MALSRCPRGECSGTSFELREIEPRHAAYKLHAIQCSSCGAVVGVMDYFNIGVLVRKLAKALHVDLDRG